MTTVSILKTSFPYVHIFFLFQNCSYLERTRTVRKRMYIRNPQCRNLNVSKTLPNWSNFLTKEARNSSKAGFLMQSRIRLSLSRMRLPRRIFLRISIWVSSLLLHITGIEVPSWILPMIRAFWMLEYFFRLRRHL